jgi:hypothetical protein
LTPKKDPIIIQPDPVEDAQVDDIKSERRAASNRNQWAASRWNAWADKSESAGECSAIAVALHRGFALGIDDNRALNRALREAGLAGQTLEILRTQDVILELIVAGVLDVAAADKIKDDWENQHRFRIKVTSFSDLL